MDLPTAFNHLYNSTANSNPQSLEFGSWSWIYYCFGDSGDLALEVFHVTCARYEWRYLLFLFWDKILYLLSSVDILSLVGIRWHNYGHT